MIEHFVYRLQPIKVYVVLGLLEIRLTPTRTQHTITIIIIIIVVLLI